MVGSSTIIDWSARNDRLSCRTRDRRRDCRPTLFRAVPASQMAAPAARRGPGRPPNSKPPTHPLGSPGRGSGARHGLPYDPDALHWVHAHTQNLEGLYCYCGSDRNLNEANLQCGGCRNWFHASCLSPALRALPLAPFVTDYSFTCALCVRKEKKMKDADGEWPGEERFQRTAGSWEHSVVAAIANLALRKMQEAKRSMHDPNIPEGDKAYYFEKNRDVCPYIDKNWKALCPQRLF